MRVFPLFTHGSSCPRCGRRTERVRTRFYLRPVRWLMPDVRRRSCHNVYCLWRGFSFPEQVDTTDTASAATMH
jgi:hypothetical protein